MTLRCARTFADFLTSIDASIHCSLNAKRLIVHRRYPEFLMATVLLACSAFGRGVLTVVRSCQSMLHNVPRASVHGIKGPGGSLPNRLLLQRPVEDRAGFAHAGHRSGDHAARTASTSVGKPREEPPIADEATRGKSRRNVAVVNFPNVRVNENSSDTCRILQKADERCRCKSIRQTNADLVSSVNPDGSVAVRATS